MGAAEIMLHVITVRWSVCQREPQSVGIASMILDVFRFLLGREVLDLRPRALQTLQEATSRVASIRIASGPVITLR